MKKSEILAQGTGALVIHYVAETGAVVALAFPSDLTLLALMKAGTSLEEFAAGLALPDGADSVLVLRAPELAALPDEVPHVHWRVADGVIVAGVEPTQTGVVG